MIRTTFSDRTIAMAIWQIGAGRRQAGKANCLLLQKGWYLRWFGYGYTNYIFFK
jgi:hypothetical protein